MQNLPQPPTDRGTHSILIVEDNQLVTKALSSLLSREGFAPVVFHQACDALEYAGRQRPDAALIDIHLPDFSGLALSRMFRELFGPELPIIVVSGDNSIDTLKALPDVGATVFFAKPVHGKTLIAKLKELMGLQPEPLRP